LKQLWNRDINFTLSLTGIIVDNTLQRFSTSDGTVQERAKAQSPDTISDEDDATCLPQLVHDLKQPLTAIGNYALAASQLINQGLSNPAQMKVLFSKIAEQCDHATQISQQLGKAVKALDPAGGSQVPRRSDQ
jgi:hypothetical protein